MHHPTDRVTHTTAFVTPVVDHCWVWVGRRLGEWVHSLKDRSYDPSHHERPLLPRSYISLPETYTEYDKTHSETVKDAALTNELVLRFERRTCQIIRNKVPPPPPPPARGDWFTIP